jgi:hypothetical protein
VRLPDPRMDLRNGLPPVDSRHGYSAADLRDPRNGGGNIQEHHRHGGHIMHDPRNGLLIDPRVLGPSSDMRDPRNGQLDHARLTGRGSGHAGHHHGPPDPRVVLHDGRFGPPQEAALRLDIGRHYAAPGAENAGSRSLPDPRLVSPQQKQQLSQQQQHLAEAGRRADSRGSNPPEGGRMDPPRSRVEHMNQEIERTLLGGYPDSSSRHSQPDSSGRPPYFSQSQADSSR